eukprot:m.313303 g.313303  ORF g.313303 m.313303 type:complete len:382 (-) comp19663_c1_seq3:23-1168(-)
MSSFKDYQQQRHKQHAHGFHHHRQGSDEGGSIWGAGGDGPKGNNGKGSKVAIEDALANDSHAYRFPRLFGSVYHVPDGWTKVFMASVLCQCLVIVILTIWDASEMNTTDDRPALMYAVLLATNQVFQVFYVIHGCLRDKRPEVIAFILGSVLVAAYEVFDYFYHPRRTLTSTLEMVKLIRLAVVLGFEPLNIVLGIYVTLQLHRLEYIIGGADPMLQLAFKKYSLAVCWLRFDLQVVVSFLILAGFAKTSPWWEMMVLGIGLALSAAWAVLGNTMMRRESKRLAVVFYVMALAVPAYAAFKVYRLDVRWGQFREDRLTTYPLFVTLALALIVRAVVASTTRSVVKAFGAGLKQHLDGGSTPITPSEGRRNVNATETTGLLS